VHFKELRWFEQCGTEFESEEYSS